MRTGERIEFILSVYIHRYKYEFFRFVPTEKCSSLVQARLNRSLYKILIKTLSCGTLSCGTLSCGTLSCSTLSCCTLSCGTLSCGTLSCCTLSCGTLSCGTLSCGTLSCGTLSCGVLSCGTLLCCTLSCGTLSCGALSCGTLLCDTLSCGTLSCGTLCRVVLFCVVLYCLILCRVVLCCVVLYRVVLCRVVLYRVVTRGSFILCLFCSSVKPAIFDLFLALGIGAYLALFYLALQVSVSCSFLAFAIIKSSESTCKCFIIWAPIFAGNSTIFALSPCCEIFTKGLVLLGLFRNRNSWNKPNSCSFSGYSDSRVAVKPS